MGNKTKIVILLIVAMGIGANAQFRNNKWYFGNGCGIEFDSKGNIINNKLPSKINTEEGSASIDITDELSLYSDGITVWDNDGNVILDKLSSNKSCTQAAMFLPRVLEGRISYVDVISLINFARPQGAAVSRIFFDEQGKYSTRPNMTNVKFTKDYLLEEKMAGFINYQNKNNLYNVLVFKAYKPLINRDSLFLIAKIGVYRDSFEIELNEQYFGDLTSNTHLNSTGYCYNGQMGILGSLIFVSPADGLIQSLYFDPNSTSKLLATNNYSFISKVLNNYIVNIYGISIFNGKNNNLIFTNASSKLYLLKSMFIDNPMFDNDSTRIASTIDSIDVGKIFNEPDISLGAIQSFYTSSPPTYNSYPSYIAVQGKNYLIKVLGDINNNTINISKVEIGGEGQLGLPSRPNLLSSCSEMIDYSLFGDAEKKNDTVKINKLKNNSCGGISFNRKININEILNLNLKFQIANGDNNKLYDGSEEGADGIAIVFSRDKIDKCQSAAGGLGYSGLRNAIAIELDLFKNEENKDPDGNHLCLKLPDSTGVLTSVHNQNDKFIKSYGLVQTLNGNYNLQLSNNNSFSYFSIDSLYDPKSKISPKKFSASGQLSLNENIQKYLGVDDFYITIYGSTGDAVEEHNLYDVQLCKGYNFEVSNPTTVADATVESNSVFLTKVILTLQEAKKLIEELVQTRPQLSIYDANGQRIEIQAIPNMQLQSGKVLFLIDFNSDTIFKRIILIN